MSQTPPTRSTLLLRIRDRSNQQAWREFEEIYRPVIRRLARHQGLQHADAEDLAQQTLVAVAGAIDRFEADADRGRFRAWLRTIAHNLAVNLLTRGDLHTRGSGDTALHEMLQQQPEATAETGELAALEYRREVFRWAARQIRDEFQAATWDAFWLTAIEGLSVDQAAAQLGKSAGAIYAARSRVMKRLKEKVREFDN